MISDFTMPSNGRVIEIKLPSDVVGSGNVGAKSAGLRRIRPLIEANEVEVNGCTRGLIYYPHVSTTPTAIREILQRMGISHLRPEEAISVLKKAEFTRQEGDMLLEGARPFEGLAITIRSDEPTPNGVGIWKSKFVHLLNLSEQREQLLGLITQILLSDFSKNVAAFRKRTGMDPEDNIGLMFMPLVGRYIVTRGAQLYTSFFHSNLITNFTRSGRTLFCVGVGLDGANNRGAITKLLDTMSEQELGTSLIVYNASKANLLRLSDSAIIDPYDHSIAPFTQTLSGLMKVYSDGDAPIISELREATDRLKAATPERMTYLELAIGGSRWVVVQACETPLLYVTKPDVPKSDKIMETEDCGLQGHSFKEFSLNVCGRGTVRTNHVYLIEDRHDYDRLAEVNENAGSYTIIVKSKFMTMGTFFESTGFSAISNASAIVFDGDTQVHSARTHLNGALREAGILVLSGDLKKGSLDDVPQGMLFPLKLLVYVNDEKEEGFVVRS